jgi:glyceraldehyde 3-phosphate dehydrogenase
MSKFQESVPFGVGINGFGRIGNYFYIVSYLNPCNFVFCKCPRLKYTDMSNLNVWNNKGRLVVRVIAEGKHPQAKIVAINDPFMTPEYMVYLLKHDSVHGVFKGDVSVDGTKVILNGSVIQTFAFKDPSEIPWTSVCAEFVCETSGAFVTADKAGLHLAGGAKKVIISAPPKDDVPMIVMGVNHRQYDANSMHIVSNARYCPLLIIPSATDVRLLVLEYSFSL